MNINNMTWLNISINELTRLKSTKKMLIRARVRVRVAKQNTDRCLLLLLALLDVNIVRRIVGDWSSNTAG